MGLRGPAPKPTGLRILEGNPSRRPINANEPQYEALPGSPPSGLSRTAKTIWRDYYRRLEPSGLLTEADGPALAELCENKAMLKEIRLGLQAMVNELRTKARRDGSHIPGNALTTILRTQEGRRLHGSMTALNAQIIARERDFGLMPGSRSRVEVNPPPPGSRRILDPIERELCG